MASGTVHRTLTEEVLTQWGFHPNASRLAADSNAGMDERQGPDAETANLHAMRGFFGAGILQSERQAREAVDALVARRREAVLTALRNAELENAYRELGAALHTIQDACYNNYRPWPIEGTPEEAPAPESENSLEPESLGTFSPPATLTRGQSPAAILSDPVPRRADSESFEPDFETACCEMQDAPENLLRAREETGNLLRILERALGEKDRRLWSDFLGSVRR